MVYSCKIFYDILIFYEAFVAGSAGITPAVKMSGFYMPCKILVILCMLHATFCVWLI